MRLLSGLTLSKIKSLGLRSLRDSFDRGREYTLLKEGIGGRLLIVDSMELSDALDSSDDYSVFDKDFLKTPYGIFKIISETPYHWLVEGDESPETILKPEASKSLSSEEVDEINVVDEPKEVSTPKKSLSAYPIGQPMRQDDPRLLEPPYRTMNKRIWQQALNMIQPDKGRIIPARILSLYKRIKNKR